MRKLGVGGVVSLEASLKEQPADGQGGILYYDGVNPDNKRAEERIACYIKSRGFRSANLDFRGFGWTFVVDNSKSEVYAPAYRMLKSIALSGVVIFIIVAAVGLLFAKSFSAKVEELLRATEEVSAGNLDARVEIATSDELEKVGAGFAGQAALIAGRSLIIHLFFVVHQEAPPTARSGTVGKQGKELLQR